MIGQILAILAAAEGATDQEQQQQRQSPAYAICVTGDHSTPVVFGDHSHEPVPFALAWVRDAVAARGGLEQLREEVKPGVKIPVPDTKQPPPLEQLLQQSGVVAEERKRREAAVAGGKQQEQQQRKESSAGKQQGEVLSGEQQQRKEKGREREIASGDGQQQQQQKRQGEEPTGIEEGLGGASLAGAAAAGGSSMVLRPEHVLWDGVVSFDELSAARGVLGRFPGSGVMPLIKQLLRQGPE